MSLGIYRTTPGDIHPGDVPSIMRSSRWCHQQPDLSAPLPWHRAVKQLAGGQTTFTPSSNMSLVQQPPLHPFPMAFPNGFDCDYPSVDLEGGELIRREQHEEIDNDGSRVIVFTFTIKFPDGEMTKTIRRKVQVDISKLSQHIRVTNGTEAEVETKCERVQGDIFGIRPMQSIAQRSLHTLGPRDSVMLLDSSNPQDLAIQDALNQVSDKFKSMLSQRQGAIMKMFPDLFAQMRTKSTLIPATNHTEVITNPDGSTTTRTRTSKSFSSSYSTQDVYVNGVKQENMSRRRFKAFVEYKGPECGFRMKLSDNEQEDLSEDETEEDDLYSPRRMNHLKAITYNNRDQHSEITDTESDIYHGTQRPDAKKRHEKAWFAAKELVDSEQRYVEKLRLLSELFRQRVLDEKAIDKDKINKLFANLSSLFQFHNTHFLPQLMEASRDWHSTKRIANVVRKQAPFLKMYSEYTNNYDRATKVFDECKKKRRFAEIVAEIERLPECEGLPLQHHLICPVQRVMRYQLLLQEYKKHLIEQDVDYADSEVALNLVLQAATHANEMMKKLEGFGKVIEVQEELGNSISLVSPGRELLRKGVIQKISSTTEKTEERTLFLFNDLIILASERRIGLAKYKLRAVFSPTHTQVCEGDNLEREHSFYLRGSDGTGPQRCIEMFCDNQREKREWMEAICIVIDDCKANSATFAGGERASISEASTQGESKHCADCDVEFSLWSRGIKCGKCRRKLCKKCFGRYRTESKNNRVCEPCLKNKGVDGVRRSQSMFNGERKNLLSVPATGEGVIHGGWVKFRGSTNKTYERYLAVRNDYCMYSYTKPTDSSALLMLPLPGCEVRMCGEANTFLLKVGSHREYKITADSEDNLAQWMALLDLAARVELKP